MGWSCERGLKGGKGENPFRQTPVEPQSSSPNASVCVWFNNKEKPTRTAGPDIHPHTRESSVESLYFFETNAFTQTQTHKLPQHAYHLTTIHSYTHKHENVKSLALQYEHSLVHTYTLIHPAANMSVLSLSLSLPHVPSLPLSPHPQHPNLHSYHCPLVFYIPPVGWTVRC